MKRLSLFGLAFVVLLSVVSAAEIEVYFSPNGGCEDAIIEEVNSAKSSINVAMYYLTERRIANALISAKQKGIKVSVVLDKSQPTQTYSKAVYLTNNGIRPFINSKYSIMHNKYAIVDGKAVITGSYNWTASAEAKNAENLLIIRDEKVAGLYRKNFDKLLAESHEFTGRKDEAKIVPVVPKAPAPKKVQDVTGYITRTGKKYQSGGCRYWSKSMIPISLKDAKARGYGPCSVCGPPR